MQSTYNVKQTRIKTEMKVFLVTVKGETVPCTINRGVIRPTIKGGYRILRLANKERKSNETTN